MAVRSKLQEAAGSIVQFFILLICCAISLLIATNVRCHSSLTTFLYNSLPKHGQRNEFHWLGSTHGMVVYLFVPLCSGIIDHFKVSYRLCSISAGVIILGSSVISTGLGDPSYLIITDTLITGLGASVLLSTIILVIDDCFPTGSNLRILATTLVQGVAFGTFFLVNGYSILLTRVGWRSTLYAFGITSAILGFLGFVLFKRESRPLQQTLPYSQLPASAEDNGDAVFGDNDDNNGDDDSIARIANLDVPTSVRKSNVSGWPHVDSDRSVLDGIVDRNQWKGRLLSLNQSELDSSSTTLLWLLERQLAALISDGVFLFLLIYSGILDNPLYNAKNPPAKIGSILTAFLFSIGSTSSYLAGGIFGCLIRGKLIVLYMIGSVINSCALIGWSAVLGSSYNGELVFAWACGFGIGAINTVSFAASEEATGIQSRSIFPFTKITNGLSIIIMEISYTALIGPRKKPNETVLLVLLLLSVVEFTILLLIKNANDRIKETKNRFRPRPSFRD